MEIKFSPLLSLAASNFAKYMTQKMSRQSTMLQRRMKLRSIRYGWSFDQFSTIKVNRTFPRMFDNIPLNVRLARNVWRHPLECLTTFPGMFGDIPRNVWRHSLEWLRTFPEMFDDIPRDVGRHSLECLSTFSFPGMSGDIPRNITFPPFPALPAFRSPFLYSWFYT